MRTLCATIFSFINKVTVLSLLELCGLDALITFGTFKSSTALTAVSSYLEIGDTPHPHTHISSDKHL